MKSEIRQLQASYLNLENKVDQLRHEVEVNFEYRKIEIQDLKKIILQSRQSQEDAPHAYRSTSKNLEKRSYRKLEDTATYVLNAVAEPAVQYNSKSKEMIYTNGIAFSFLISIISLGFLIDFYGTSSTNLIIGFISTFILLQTVIIAFNISRNG